MKVITDGERKRISDEIIIMAEKEIEETGKFEYRISQNWWGNYLTRLSLAHEERLYDMILDMEEDNNWNDSDLNAMELDNRYKGIKDAFDYLEKKYKVNKIYETEIEENGKTIKVKLEGKEKNNDMEKEVTIEIITLTK